MKEKNHIKNIIKDIGKQLGLLAIYFVIIEIYASIFIGDLKSKNMVLFNLSNICFKMIILVVFVILLRKIIIPDFYDFKRNGKLYIKDSLKYWIYGLFVMTFSNAIIGIFIDTAANQDAVIKLFNQALVYYLIAVIIIAPITEELLTRSILKNTFYHPIIYYTISAFIFGLLHVLPEIANGNMIELLYIIPYGALGFFFAKMYHETDNIWTNIFFHFLHNLIATILVAISIFGGM